MKQKPVLIMMTVLTVLAFSSNSIVFGQACGCSTSEAEAYEALALEACTSVLVGKKASTDGSIITTHTNDCGVCDWTFRYVPPADNEPGAKRKIYWYNQYETLPPSQGYHWSNYEHKFNGLEIDEVEHTYGYFHGMFGYLNDNQVGFGESSIGCRRELQNPTPAAKFDITQLSLIAMERARTAREAVRIMGDLATRHGFGHTDRGEMLAVSDPNEVWIFEIMGVGPLWNMESGKPGAIWCAQRIPDDHICVCPNESRIGEIDLKNKDFFMASENVITQAIEMGLYDPQGGEPFNWKKTYSPRETSASASKGSSARLWRFLDLVAPSKNFSPDTPNMELPFSVKPDKKISVTDVFDILRDNYEGTPFYTAKGIMGGPFENPNYTFRSTLDEKQYRVARSIGMNRSEYTTVIQVRDWLPDPIGGLIWLGLGSLNTTCFAPFYGGITRMPKSYQFGDHWELDRRVARWAFDYTDFHTQVVYSYAIQDVRKAQTKWERSAVERTREIDEKALALYKESPEKARKFLTDYSCDHAHAMVNAWWKLGDNLLVKYNHFSIYDSENRKRDRLEYPEAWIRALIKVNGLESQPPRR